MAKVDPNNLDAVLAQAGVSDEIAGKIREANSASTPKPRGQGSSEKPEFSQL